MRAKHYPLRPSEVEARKRAMAGARMKIAGMSQEDAAKASNSTISSVSLGVTIINHGTAEEIASVDSGEVALGVVYDAIIARTTPEERKAKYPSPKKSEKSKGYQQVEIDLWQALRAALESINSMPKPSEVAAVVRRHGRRIDYINRSLLTAVAWIKEFEDEITR
jgi:hypothetical protein